MYFTFTALDIHVVIFIVIIIISIIITHLKYGYQNPRTLIKVTQAPLSPGDETTFLLTKGHKPLEQIGSSHSICE